LGLGGFPGLIERLLAEQLSLEPAVSVVANAFDTGYNYASFGE
jgi:hypothetical protein